MALVETDSQNVQQVNTDVDSMTKQLQEMASVAKSLESNLNGVNNELTAISKQVKRSSKVFEDLTKKSDLTKMSKNIRQAAKDLEKFNNGENGSGSRKGKKSMLGDIPAIQKLIKLATSPIALLGGLVGGAIKAIQGSMKMTNDAANKLTGASSKLMDSLGEAGEEIKNAYTKNTINTVQSDAVFSDIARSLSQIWVGLKSFFAKYWAKIQGKDLEDYITEQYEVNAASSKASAENALRYLGFDSSQISSLVNVIQGAAEINALKYEKNQKLGRAGVLYTQEYQQEFNRLLGLVTGSASGNIFEGFMAQHLGEKYVPNVTRSKEVQAEYISQMIAKLAPLSLDQQSDLISTWENAGTVLNKVGQNLYSFDEVISQDTMEVNDKKASEILGDILTNLKNKDAILNSLQQDVDTTAGTSAAASGISASTASNKLFTSVDEARAYQSAQGASLFDIASMSTEEVAKELYDKYAGGTGYNVDTGTYYSATGADVYASNIAAINAARSRYVGTGVTNSITSNDKSVLKSGTLSGSDEEILIEHGNVSGNKTKAVDIPHDASKYLYDWLADRTGYLKSISPSSAPSIDALMSGITQASSLDSLFDTRNKLGELETSIFSPQNAIDALHQTSNSGSNISVNVELSGINIADNERQWNEVARNIGERINTITRREGGI